MSPTREKFPAADLIATGTITAFLFLKLSQLVFRFGDGNAYIYMAHQFGHLIPYQDFFLADPPFLVLTLAFLKLFFGDKLILFQSLPVIFEAGTALFIFLLLKKWGRPLSFLAPAIYLFSFTVLSTSDYLTGVQLISFLSVLAIWAWEKEWIKLSGVLWSLAVLTKLYVLPAFAGFAIFAFLKKDRRIFWTLTLSAAASFILVMLPFLLLSAPEVFNYLVVHQLNRPAGNDKLTVLKFFMAKEWLLLILAAAGFLLPFKKLKITAPLVLLAVFFFIYRDLYYLYLGSIMPYLVLLCVYFLGWLWTKGGECKTAATFIIVLYAVFSFSSFSEYRNNFANRGGFLNSDEIAAYIKTLPENFKLYGSHEVAPLIALKSGRKLFDDQADTNAQVFSSGVLDIGETSRKIAADGAYLLTRTIDRPEYGLTDFGYEGFLSKEVFEKSCHQLRAFPSTSNETDNLIAVFRCKD